MDPQRLSLFCCVVLLFSFNGLALKSSAGDTVSVISEARVKAFLEEEIEFDRYIFPPGQFPTVRWKDPAKVEGLIGHVPLTVEFLDSSYGHVSRAEHPGRYGAVVRGQMPDGFRMVRYSTLYCSNIRFDDYGPDVPLVLQSLPDFGIPSSHWEIYRNNLRRFSFGSLLLFPEHDPDAAVFLAGLAELTPVAPASTTPRLIDRLWWITFKRRNDHVPHPTVDLSLRSLEHPGPVLTEGQGPSRRSIAPGDRKVLLDICREWTDSSGVPMTAVVVHKGQVVFHEAFGRSRDGKQMTRETPTWMASITKTLTGVLVMQFVDRGIVQLDTPIDRYLPELASSLPCPLTLRLLLTHLSGLEWAGEWASDWNPSMENQVAQALPLLTPGRQFKYHRAGYALAGKVLERISGKTVPQLFERMILVPLGMTRSIVDNTYGGLFAPALELARFGQMLLGRGRYGSYEFLSEKAWKEMLPTALRTNETLQQKAWGIGTAPFGRDGLSDATFGHSAASGAVFRVDPVHDLVVVVGRDAVGPDENQYRLFASRFIRALTTALDRGPTHD